MSTRIRLAMVLAIIALAVGPAAAMANVKVVQPNGGETCTEGSAYFIRWVHSGSSTALVRIELLLRGNRCRVIAGATPNDGSFLWQVSQCGSVETGYTIRVSELGSGPLDRDESNGPFRILRNLVCVTRVTSPRAGDDWVEGSSQVVRWTRTNACGDRVKIDLLRNGVLCHSFHPGATSTPNDGSALWTEVRRYCGDHRNGYQIRVTDVETGRSGVSGVFSIPEPACNISVTSPRHGDNWVAGSSQVIRWTQGGGCSDRVKIYLLRNGTVCHSFHPGGNSTANDGNALWNQVRRLCGDHSGGYQIRVRDFDSGRSGVSGVFSIPLPPPPPCNITVTSPRAGDSWADGSSQAIRWTESGSCGDRVRIDLLRDGSVCRSVSGSTANDGSTAWNPVRQCQGYSDRYQIRVTDLDSGRRGVSGNFSIPMPTPPCTITVTAPNGGEAWTKGDRHDIRWSHSERCSPTSPVKIELLSGGSVCKTIATSTANDGGYTWPTVPCSGTSDYQIRVTHLDSGHSDVSDANFSINPCVGELVVADAQGDAGQQVEVEIRLESNSVPVGAFGVDLAYDTSVLQFVGGQAGDLNSAWMTCEAVENTAGVVTVGGFDMTAIPAGQTGSIARLQFDVICATCVEGDDSALQLSNLVSDVASMSTCDGTFTYGLFCQSDGDVDGNGQLSSGDARCAFGIFLAAQTVSGSCDATGFDCEIIAADVDCDGTVTPADALAIFSRALGGGLPESCFASPSTAQPVGTGMAVAAAPFTAVDHDRNLYRVELGDRQALPDGRVSVPLTMAARAGQTAVGFELAFDHESLEFVGLEVETAARDWQAFDATEVEPGRLIVGGFDSRGLASGAIDAAGGDGTVRIANLVFRQKTDSPSFGAVTWKAQVLGAGDDGPMSGTPSTSRLAFGQPYPNPIFRGDQVMVNLSLPAGAAHEVKVAVYDVQGRLVKSLLTGQLPGGNHVIQWDRKAEGASSVRSGIYFMTLRAGNVVEKRKIVVVE